MPRGQQPKPSEIKKLEGNRARLGRDRIKDDPKGVGRPRCPPHLDPDERKIWLAVVAALPAALLSAADDIFLEVLSSNVIRAATAIRTIKRTGQMVQSPNGPVRNPLFVIVNHAERTILAYGTQLGLSPLARARLLAIPDDEDDPMALLLGMEGEDDGMWASGRAN